MSNLKRNPYIWDIGNQDERDLIHKYECVVAKCENIKVTKKANLKNDRIYQKKC